MKTISPPDTYSRQARNGREIEPLTLVAAALRHRRVLVGVPLAFALASVVITLLTPRQYESDFTFMPQQPEANNQVGSLAAQFGVRLSGFSEAESPTFYADLIHSRAVLLPVLEREFAFTTDTGAVRGTYAEIYEIEFKSPARLREESVIGLRNRIKARADEPSGVVEVEISTHWPELSYQLAQAVLESVNQFNLEVRRSRAQSEREFAEVRLQEARDQLREAESQLQQFMDTNQRGIDSSAQLRIAFDRLSRRVEHQQALVLSMMQAYEQARLDEVRNTPVITVVASPQLPGRPASRGGLIRLIVALLLGVLVAGVVIAAREYLDAARSERPEDLETVRRLGRQALGDLTLARRAPRDAS